MGPDLRFSLFATSTTPLFFLKIAQLFQVGADGFSWRPFCIPAYNVLTTINTDKRRCCTMSYIQQCNKMLFFRKKHAEYFLQNLFSHIKFVYTTKEEIYIPMEFLCSSICVTVVKMSSEGSHSVTLDLRPNSLKYSQV